MTQDTTHEAQQLSKRERGHATHEYLPGEVDAIADSEHPMPGVYSSITTSLRWRILSIALISGLALALSTFFTTSQTHANSRLVENIFKNKYPVQVLTESAKHELFMLNRALNDAIITGDEEAVSNTDPIARAFRDNMLNTAILSPEFGNEIDELLNSFDAYYDGARVLANSMLEAYSYNEELAEQGVQSQKNYESVVDALDTFQRKRLNAFAQAVEAATLRAEEAIVLATWSGGLIVLAALVLAYIISRSILLRIRLMVSTLKHIAKGDGRMQSRIRLNGAADEMAELAHWFNTFLEKLERVTTESTAEIKRIAYTDALSGLPNRRKLIESISEVIEEDTDTTGKMALFFLDLDNFKPINDQYGHEMGDELIRQAANRLQVIVDSINLKAESVRHHASVGRLGGDEFMVILPNAEGRETNEIIARRLIDTLLDVFNLQGTKVQIGVSIGISQYPEDATSRGKLMDCSDAAMYESKRAGKNTFRFYETAMHEEAQEQLKIENALKTAIATDELTLNYQPKFNIKTRQFTGAEALLRWNSEELGFISPAVFIPIAEKAQMIKAIDEWVLGRVCRQINAWLERGLEPPRIAVNLSAQQIQNRDLISNILPILTKHGTPRKYLELEITETSVIDNLDIVTENVQSIRELGMHVSMDDFGAGHSSLQLLVNCKLDTVKIDKSLIDHIEDNDRNQKIIMTIINLSRTLDFNCVAEGIEEESQLKLLQELECQVGQGYLFSKPLPADVFESSMLEPDSERKTA